MELVDLGLHHGLKICIDSDKSISNENGERMLREFGIWSLFYAVN